MWSDKGGDMSLHNEQIIEDSKFKTMVAHEFVELTKIIYAGNDKLTHLARIIAWAQFTDMFLKDLKNFSDSKLSNEIDKLLAAIPSVFGSLIDNITKGITNPTNILH
jgi:hypothetical protein